ncbi:hypothetical protein [Lyngbya aestuarii]|uniref:hypothetical protein n=1 Tax=Lyngbya aestuarii TaxID=118322 RepID=UPI00403E0B18
MSHVHHTEEFQSSIELFVDALQLQDKQIATSCEKALAVLYSPEYAADVIKAAVLHLAKTDFETFQWILQNSHTLEFGLNWLKEFILSLVQKLISQGFILGQDFSATHTGKLWINKKAQAALMENVSPVEFLFLEEILQIPKEEP